MLYRATEGAGNDEPAVSLSGDPLLDWGGRVAGELGILDMPGGHSTMLQEPYVEEVAESIVSYIDECLSPNVSV